MILCDFSMIAISNLMSYMSYNPNDQLNVELVRHITLNALRSYKKQFSRKYGDMVICCDSRSYWRKSVFPHYKAKRKKAREDSKHDWKFIFDTLSQIKLELKHSMPYRVVEVEGAEGDDVIASLAMRYSGTEPILILSSDKDFVQLQRYPDVAQYNPTMKRFIETPDPDLFTKEHIIRGDSNDGIPNALSPADTFVSGGRQKRLNTEKVGEWLTQDPKDYEPNQQLIDLNYIPKAIREQIEQEFMLSKPANTMAMADYFIANDLQSLMEVMDEF
jgi:5'-3' exonuclease